MKKYLLTLFTFFLLISPLGIQTALAANQPTKVTATSGPIDVFIGVLEYTLDFWNVGSEGGSQYGTVTVYIKCIEATGDWDCSEEDLGPVEGTFTGGPNGHFEVEGVGFDLIDGQKTTVYDGGYELVFTVNNPDAFKNWGENNTGNDKDEYVNLPKNENWTETPTGEMPDYSFPKINKVMGEVEISDPNKRSGMFDSIYRGWSGDQEPWRAWEGGAAGQQLIKQSVIRTGTGRAILEFTDGNKIVLEENSKITINDAGFTIENGSGSFKYKKYGQKFILEARYAKFGIVGTEVSWEVNGDDVIFNVLEGKVEAESQESGQKITMNPGDRAQLDYNNELVKSEFDIDKEAARWNQVEESAMNSTSIKTTNWQLPVILIAVVVLAIIFIIAVIIFIIILVTRKKKTSAQPVDTNEKNNQY